MPSPIERLQRPPNHHCPEEGVRPYFASLVSASPIIHESLTLTFLLGDEPSDVVVKEALPELVGDLGEVFDDDDDDDVVDLNSHVLQRRHAALLWLRQ